MEWIRGGHVGRGAFATVDFAIPNPNSSPIDPPLPSIVVKSADFSMSDSLRNERQILRRLGGSCRQIAQCLGDARTAENGRDLYNLFFEYAANGSLADRLKNTAGNQFPDLEIRRITNSILKGLAYVHDRGIVHCDIKLENVLVFADGGIKISDFGLAKERAGRAARKEGVRFELRGTPLYMAPEVVAGGAVDAPADVWAVGCAVVLMATGSPAWRCGPGCGVGELLCRIGGGKSAPEIPGCLGEEGRDFVGKCFVKDPNERWTARMLLDHPFLSGSGEESFCDCECETTSSPRGPFEFSEWTPTACNEEAWWECDESGSVVNRFEGLVGEPGCEPDWSDADEWVVVILDC